MIKLLVEVIVHVRYEAIKTTKRKECMEEIPCEDSMQEGAHWQISFLVKIRTIG